MFTGGSLIVGSVARTDLLGAGRAEELARAQCRSLRRLAALPGATAVWPTHGAGSFCSAPPGAARTTTIGAEKAANALLAAPDEDAFARLLLAGLGSYPAYFGRLAEINRKGPLTDRQRFRWNMDPRPAQKIMGMPIDPEGDISYRLSMDQISALAARLHVDLRRQASAVCRGAACAEGRAAA